MTKLMFNTGNVPFIDRDEFITPFDRLFDQIIDKHYPEVTDQIGVKPYQGSAYPKVNVYEYDDKVGIVAEIPGLTKKQLNVEVEDNVLTISGDKHGVWEEDGAKVLGDVTLTEINRKGKPMKINCRNDVGDTGYNTLQRRRK